MMGIFCGSGVLPTILNLHAIPTHVNGSFNTLKILSMTLTFQIKFGMIIGHIVFPVYLKVSRDHSRFCPDILSVLIHAMLNQFKIFFLRFDVFSSC